MLFPYITHHHLCRHRETHRKRERERTSTWWWERTRGERICSNLLSFFFAKLSNRWKTTRQEQQGWERSRFIPIHRRRRRLAQVTFWALISCFFLLFWLFDNIIRQGKEAHRLIVARNTVGFMLRWVIILETSWYLAEVSMFIFFLFMCVCVHFWQTG